MPKISKITLHAGDRNQEFELHYNISSGFYLKGFPQTWIDTVRSVDKEFQNISMSFPTEKDCLITCKQIMKRYYEITAITRRVILIKVGYGKAIRMGKTGIGSYSGSNPRVGSVGSTHFHDCADIDLEWAVGFEWTVATLTHGTEEKYFELSLNDKYEEIERTKYANTLRKSDGFVIDWTPERHEFFLSMERGMEKMAKAMATFFGNKNRMEQLIDTKGFKLLTN